jgi:hypothetical protein
MGSALTLSSCTGSGTMSVYISDHREAIGDFEHFTVEIEEIAVHRAGSLGDRDWFSFAPAIRDLDLTQVAGDRSVKVYTGPLPAGAYDAVSLSLSNVEGILKEGEAIQFGDFVEGARLDFTLQDSGSVDVLIELVVQSRHDHPGEGYVLLLTEARLLPIK